MRATSNPPTPDQIADQVWDELSAGHTGGTSFGGGIGNMTNRVTTIWGDYTRRTAYTYGPTGLAAGATYVPAAGTVMTVAALDTVDADDFRIMHGTIEVIRGNIANEQMKQGYVGMIYCDGTDVGVKNNDTVQRDLVIEGFTL